MKRFDIITEADARALDVGETVALTEGRPRHAAGRRHAEGIAASRSSRTICSIDRGRGLAPVADIRRVAIGSDHTGLALKAAIVGGAARKGHCRGRSRHAHGRSGRLSRYGRSRREVRRARRGRCRHRHRRRRHRIGDRREQDRRAFAPPYAMTRRWRDTRGSTTARTC